MATATFDKVFIATKPEDQERIIKVLTSDKPARKVKTPLYTQKERERSEAILKKYFSRYNS